MNVPGNPRDGDPYRPPVGYGQNPGGYGQAPGYGTPPARPRNGFGIAALVLGILALVLCWTVVGGILFGILAVIFGLLGRGRAKRGEATNGGLSLAGVVLGVIGLIISIGLIAFGLSLANSPAYRQCAQQAGGDLAKLQQCASDLGRQVGGRP
ncbi:MAG: DUF4190 domain-containing protein [Pseudonocardiaceae bacterium]